MLMEQTQAPDSALPLDGFKGHLRIGSGFADDGDQDALLVPLLKAAIAAIEAWTGKILLERRFKWVLTDWREGDGQPLPLAPIKAIESVKMVDVLGWEQPLASETYWLQPDTHRPVLRPVGAQLPAPSSRGEIHIELSAGFGPSWSDVPADLGQAVLVLAAHYYEDRTATNREETAIPYAVSALIERWRTVRLLGGGRR